MNNIRALVLAGGKGKRFQPLSFNKVLTSFLGVPIIEYVINDLIRAGVNNIIIVCNSKNHQFIKKIGLRKKAKIKTVIQKKADGMADALMQGRSLLENMPLLIVNAVDLFEKNVFSNFISQAKDKKILFGALKTDQYLPGGYFKLKKKKIIGLVEKPGPEKMPSRFYKLVLDYFQKADLVFDYLSKARSKKDDLYEVALDMMIKKEKIEMGEIKGLYSTIKYPWDILKMMGLILKTRINSKIHKDSEISPKAVIKEPVFIEKGVKIFEGAIIKGPVYLGKNTLVANNALVRDSIVGHNSLVGYNTEVARSWVGDKVFFHCNYIGDSVVEADNNFGSGARLANLRLDKEKIVIKKGKEKLITNQEKLGAIVAKGTMLGCNCVTNPGTVLGKKCLVYPLTNVQAKYYSSQSTIKS
jgi:NDP-sugar pyrophosphorylase family protein